MSTKDLLCWKCGAPLTDILLPLARQATCRSCNAHLHCCRLCLFYDTTVSRKCREPIAEEVQDKQRANFCGYLQPNPAAWSGPGGGNAAAAESELNALFGLDPGQGSGAGQSDADAARRKLDDLFGD